MDNNKNYEFMTFLIKAFVSVFGIGYIRIAPGTFGSLFAILVWYISINYLNIYFFYMVVIIVFICSFKAINIYLRYEDKDDPSEVVVDEFIGQSLPLIFLLQFNVYEVLLAFSSFRLFDIFKIYPVNKVENIKGATGVIMDDVVAGIYSLIIIMIYKIILFLNA